jgi:peptide-methionine (R)-S-oxide reductase
MQATTLAVLGARARIAIGAAAFVAPGTAARLMGGDSGGDGLAPMFARMVGARDVALGLGTVVAVDRRGPVRGWLEGAALADAGDVVATLLARRRLTPAAFAGTLAVAAGASVGGALLARKVDPSPAPEHAHPETVATGHHAATADDA